MRAVVRRAGTTPDLPGVQECVGDFLTADFAAGAVHGVAAVVTTVHPMGSDLDAQRRVGVEGNTALVRAARDAGVERVVHISTAAVYDRSPGAGDVDESSTLVGDDAGDYAVTKRDTDAALGEIEGITRILLRPPAIVGQGDTSIWNTLRPVQIRDEESARHTNPEWTFAWVHVDDLAAFAADLATGRIESAPDPVVGPAQGGCTAVNVAAGPATSRDYYEAVTGALGVEPIWEDGPAWTGEIVADRAKAWGWTPQVDRAAALSEIAAGLTAINPSTARD